MKGADADLRIRLEKAILDAEADCRMSFADRVECAIHQLVPTGPASAEEICHLLAINERTLRPEPTERPVLNVHTSPRPGRCSQNMRPTNTGDPIELQETEH